MRISIAKLPDVPSFVDAGITHLVSVDDPDHCPPDLRPFYSPSNYLRAVLRLQFHDLDRSSVVTPGNYGSVGTTYPSEASMERLIRFAESLTTNEIGTGHTLFHCFGGMYRSPSAALIFLLAIGWSPEDAWRYILSVHPSSSLNLLMIELAEPILLAHGHSQAEGLLALAESYLKKFDL